MKKLRRRFAPVVALVPLLLGTVLVGTSAAVHVACGATITQSTTLDSDVGPCAQGIRVTANNITLNLGGRTVRGTDATGDGAGILLDGVTGVTVRNGRVINFDAGVVIQGGSNNTVTDISAQNNIGTAATDFGDGIAVFGSSGNIIRRNKIQRNGPYSGISLVGNSDNNLIDSNTIQGNNVQFNAGVNQDQGIRVEGPGVNGNIVTGNKVEASGLDGIIVFPGAQNGGNTVRLNITRANGFHTKAHRTGNGIVVGANDTLIERNTSERNAASGIRVNGRNNTIRNNTARNNAQFVNPGTIQAGGAFDLHDTQFNCDNNVWQSNVFITRSQPCIS